MHPIKYVVISIFFMIMYINCKVLRSTNFTFSRTTPNQNVIIHFFFHKNTGSGRLRNNFEQVMILNVMLTVKRFVLIHSNLLDIACLWIHMFYLVFTGIASVN